MIVKRSMRWATTVILLAGAVIGGGTSALRADDDSDELREFYSANGLINRGLHELAAVEYRKFLNDHPSHEKAPVAKYGLGVCLYHLKKFEEAAEVLSPLRKIKEFAFSAEVATMLGQCHLETGHEDAALEDFEDVLAHQPKHALADDAAAGMVEALYRLGRYGEVITRCGQIDSRWPNSPLRIRTTFLSGLSAMQKGDPQAAAARFEELLKDHPDDSLADQATSLLAQYYHRANLLDRAVEEYQRVLSRAGSHFVPDALHGLGLLALQHGDPQTAGTFFDRLLKDYSDNPLAASARFYRGRAWFEAGDFDRALDMFEQCRNEHGGVDADQVAYWIAKCSLKKGRYADAATALEQVSGEFPKSALLPEAAYDRAVALARSGQSSEAVAALEAFRTRFPNQALAKDALWLLATLEHDLKNYDKSLEHCRTYLKLLPKDAPSAEALCLMAENEFLSSRFEEAAASFERCLAADPTGPQAVRARLRRGTALYDLGKFDEAEPILKKVVADGAGEFEFARFALGDICFQRGEWKNAIAHLQTYSKGDAGTPALDDALLKVGIAQQREHDYAAALKSLDRLLQEFAQSPFHLQAVFERGQTLVLLGRWEEAAATFRQVMAEGADSRFAPYALNHLGSIAMKDGDFQHAAEFFEKAAERLGDADGAAESLFQRGQALLAAGQAKAAEHAFQKLIDGHPKHDRALEARAQLAVAISRQNRYADAIDAIARLERHSLDKLGAALRAAVLYEKAWCLHQLDRKDEAIAAYRTLLDLHPGGDVATHATLELAGLEANQGRYQVAADLVRGLPREDTAADSKGSKDISAQRIYQLAVYEYQLGKFSEAAELFGEFLSSYPDHAQATSASFYCGESLVKIGRFEPAVAHLTKVAKGASSGPLYLPSLLRLGEALAHLQRWARSEEVFAEYLDHAADGDQWFQAQFGVGWAREHQGRHGEAISAFEKVVARHKGPTAARAQFQIGECLFAQNKFEDAARELLKVDILYAYPEWSAAALYEAGQCFNRLAQRGQARKQFQDVVERFEGTKWADMASVRLSELSASAVPGR